MNVSFSDIGTMHLLDKLGAFWEVDHAISGFVTDIHWLDSPWVIMHLPMMRIASERRTLSSPAPGHLVSWWKHEESGIDHRSRGTAECNTWSCTHALKIIRPERLAPSQTVMLCHPVCQRHNCVPGWSRVSFHAWGNSFNSGCSGCW
jgi:hypothetical protein